MSRERMQHCDNCGEEIGVFAKPSNEFESCGKMECNREVQGMYRQQREERYERASEDDFGRY